MRSIFWTTISWICYWMRRQRGAIPWREKGFPVLIQRFVLIGSMNPEEGNLRPQLLDRFGMVVDVEAETDVDKRVQIIENRMAYEKNPGYFCRKYKESQEELSERIRSARELLPTVRVPKELLRLAAQICVATALTATGRISE